jgi:hypothetical protein
LAGYRAAARLAPTVAAVGVALAGLLHRLNRLDEATTAYRAVL